MRSSRQRLIGGVSFVAIGSACASIMGVDEAALQGPDAGALVDAGGGARIDEAERPVEEAVGADACAGEGCPCASDSECRDDPYRRCVGGKCSECTLDPDSCAVGRYCQAGTEGVARCTLGCKSDAECQVLSAGAPLCNTDRHQCVVCRKTEDCSGTNQECSPSGVCADRCTGDGGTCPDGKTCCSGLCVDVETDIFNCKTCGTACTGGNPLCCAGQCRDSLTSTEACGSCSKTCKATTGTPACVAGACLPATCADILLTNPQATSGVYVVDPDGPGRSSSFSVLCDMTTAGGGWTLVARERSGTTGQLRYLGVDTQNPTSIASGFQSGIIGRRFSGKYTQAWIAWDNGRFIRFTIPAGSDLFANAVATSILLSDVTTSESALSSWFQSGGGAKACIATRYNNVRPGDTSWAIKPRNDDNNVCGCNSMAWVGRGAFYGGTAPPGQTSCDGWGGGWAGVKDTGQQKGGITPNYETQIWIR